MNPNKALWEKGDFTRIADTMRDSGEALIARLGIAPAGPTYWASTSHKIWSPPGTGGRRRPGSPTAGSGRGTRPTFAAWKTNPSTWS
jgi:hypothetical protein